MAIYWDYNAGAPLRPEVASLLASRLTEDASRGNPSSIHRLGRAQRARFEGAREKIAKLLGWETRDVVFTASGSEANALVLRGHPLPNGAAGPRRILTSALEHPALLATAEGLLHHDGAQVERVSPDAEGAVHTRDFESLSHGASLVSLMAANNETGVVQPAVALATACRQRGVLFHSDAVQAAGRRDISRAALDADFLTLSGHKLGAPAGVGVLLARRDLAVSPLVAGHQENGRRGGTPNVAYAEAMALALELALAEREAEDARLRTLRDGFEALVRERVTDVHVHGGALERLPHVSNLRFEGADGEALLIALDLESIFVSSGAACASGTLKPSHVLLAMGQTSTQAQASVRFSLGRGTTEAEVEKVVAALVKHVPRARDAAKLSGS